MTERAAAILDRASLTREQLLNALFRLIARDGYPAATVSALAKEAHLARGTISYHFGSKDEMLRMLARALGVAERDRWVRTVLPKAPVPEQLSAAMHVLVRTGDPSRRDFARNWVAFRAFAAEDEKLRRWMEDYERDLSNRLREIVSAGVRRRVFRPVDEEVAVLTILGAIEGVLQKWGQDGSGPLIDRSAQQLFDMVDAFLFAKPPPRLASRG